MMPDITIYLSDDLHRRVKEAELAVSKIAQEAFKEALDRHERILSDPDPVVQRLRGTIADYAALKRKEGREVGDEWAKETADAWELGKVAEMDDEDFDRYLDEIAYRIRKDIGVDSTLVINDPHEDRLLGLENGDFRQGFLEGAREVWRAVANRL
jgi:hypothetical protein